MKSFEKMFTRNIIISQQSFINIVNTSSTIFRKRIQKFSFPLHPGLMTIKHNRDETFSMYYNMKNNMNIKNKIKMVVARGSNQAFAATISPE